MAHKYFDPVRADGAGRNLPDGSAEWILCLSAGDGWTQSDGDRGMCQCG